MTAKIVKYKTHFIAECLVTRNGSIWVDSASLLNKNQANLYTNTDKVTEFVIISE